MQTSTPPVHDPTEFTFTLITSALYLYWYTAFIIVIDPKNLILCMTMVNQYDTYSLPNHRLDEIFTCNHYKIILHPCLRTYRNAMKSMQETILSCACGVSARSFCFGKKWWEFEQRSALVSLETEIAQLTDWAIQSSQHKIGHHHHHHHHQRWFIVRIYYSSIIGALRQSKANESW